MRDTIFISKAVGDENAKGLRKTRLGLHDVHQSRELRPINPTLLSPGARRLGNGQIQVVPDAILKAVIRALSLMEIGIGLFIIMGRLV